MKYLPLALAAAVVATPAFAADTVAYNSGPNDTWYFGGGNDYTPANTLVLTTDAGDQMYLRMHQTYQPAPASDGSGVYSFALGTDPMSFDWGVDNDSQSNITGLITMTNIGTGSSLSYDPFFTGNDNELMDSSTQNSFRLNWGGIGFDPGVDDTYRVDLTINGLGSDTSRTLSVFAKLGDGAMGAVPEPATWALMILGFGFIGGIQRKTRQKVKLTYA
ncbi:PEPxxWA-CTERM sorting domain-containing protein [Qipengyuania algicida]|nr:PEPxxWA-CTERM sorting domain-containing protein [Qipengyuania algicida]